MFSKRWWAAGVAAALWGAAACGAAETGVDEAIRPGDDFFGYANGAWLKATEIPAGAKRWGARNEIGVAAKQQVAAVIDAAVEKPSTPTARRVADFHAAYVDEARIEAGGLSPVASELDRIARLRDKTALSRWLGAHVGSDVDPLDVGVFSSRQLLGLAVSHGIHGERRNFAYLVQGGLGGPDREAYLDASPPMQAVRGKYEAYVARLLALAGFDHPAERAAAVLRLETEIARSHAKDEESGRETNADNHWTRAELARRAPGMDWPAFLGAAGLADAQDIVAWQPGAITGIAALVASQPLDVWKDYLRVHVLDADADVLPRAYADAAAAFRGQGSRAERALDATNAALPQDVGRLYVAAHFPPQAKARAQAIVDDVKQAFIRRVEAVGWLSPASKTLAVQKLRAMYFGVGYPDEWPDDSRLAISSRDAVGNLRRIEEWKHRQALRRLKEPVDPRAWSIPAQAPVAVLNFLANSYNFSAALLQPPKFDPRASDAANYGAIGAIFGHEISHFVDTLGADYDAQGALRPWWTAQDRAGYDAAVRPLVAQFSAYRPLPDAPVNGKTTLTENLADLAGLAAAFDAYRATLGPRAADPAYVREQDRQFFIGYARSWRSKFTEDALRAQLASDVHAPDRWRIATVRNIDAWYDAFDVQPGQALYLEPAARVRAW